MNIIWITIIVLGVTGIIAAVVLWFVAKKFYVHEDPKIAEVEAVLPAPTAAAAARADVMLSHVPVSTPRRSRDLPVPAPEAKVWPR